MILLCYFSFLFLLVVKNKSVALLFVVVQLVSLFGALFINLDYKIDSDFKVFNLLITAVILSLIILPWKNFINIEEITVNNQRKLTVLTNFLLRISLIPFITLSIVALSVFLLVDDINEFKYMEGVSVDFYYRVLPINVKLFILSTYLYYFSYFLIPLHFYYLYKGKNKLAFLCFLLSLNIVLHGLAFFSRAVFTHYGLLYISFLILFYNMFNNNLKRKLKLGLIISLTFTVFYFITITSQRFTEDVNYENIIPRGSPIQDPVLYSYFDYLSQWYSNGMYVLNSYDYNTFNGQITFQPILSLMSIYGLISYDSKDYILLRRELWPDHWYTFNGLVAYVIYDYGYILSLILALFYYYLIKKMRPRNKKISIINLFLIVFLIQFPLLAIFYSPIVGIIIPLLILIPIYLYLKLP